MNARSLSLLALAFSLACGGGGSTTLDGGSGDAGPMTIDTEAGASMDAGGDADASADLDAGAESDAGGDADASADLDAGAEDAGGDADASADVDAGAEDAGAADDAGAEADAATTPDGGTTLPCDPVACAARGSIACEGDTLVQIAGACEGDTCRVTTTRTDCTGARSARCNADNTFENSSGYCDDTGATPMCGTRTVPGTCPAATCGCADGACAPWDIDAQTCQIAAGVAACTRQIFTCDPTPRSCSDGNVSHTAATCVPGTPLPSCRLQTTTTSCTQPHCVIEPRGGAYVHVSRTCTACGASGDCTGCTETACGAVGSCDTGACI